MIVVMGTYNTAPLFLQEFNIAKLQEVETEKQKIRKEYERKEGQVDVKKKMYVFITVKTHGSDLSLSFSRLNYILLV